MEITKTNNIITFKESVNDKKEVPVSLLQDALITKSGGVVIISYKYGDIKIDYTEVTTPVVTSADTLMEELKTLIGESSNGLNYEYTDNKSTSVLTDGLSDLKYPSVKAVKDYVDDSIAGLLDYRGGFDASLCTFPTVGGSGTAGAIKKGDAFVISSSGTLDSILVSIGDFIVAKIDNATDSSADWDILSGSVAYTPENAANKVTGVNVNSTDDQYPSAKAMYTALQGKVSTANHALSINGQNLTIVGGNTVTLPSGGTLEYLNTAADGHNAATATQLINGFNYIDYSPDAISGVALPFATEGSEIYLVNRSFQPIYVYGDINNSAVIKYSIINFNSNSSRITVKNYEGVRFIKVDGGWFAENFVGKDDKPKVYKAYLTSTGQNNPTTTVLNSNDANYLGDLSWIWASNTGTYSAAKSGVTSSNSIINVNGMDSGGNVISYSVQSFTGGFGFKQFISGIAANGLYKCYVTIEYYGS